VKWDVAAADVADPDVAQVTDRLANRERTESRKKADGTSTLPFSLNRNPNTRCQESALMVAQNVVSTCCFQNSQGDQLTVNWLIVPPVFEAV